MRISDWSSDVCSSDLFVKIYSHREGALGRLGTEGKGWWPIAAGRGKSTGMNEQAVPESWRAALPPALASPEPRKLGGWLSARAQAGEVIYPPRGHSLAAPAMTPLDTARVGTMVPDPHRATGQAHGQTGMEAVSARKSPS